MSITPDVKEALIKDYATKPGDTGSPEVQVAILTSRINTLTEHFKTPRQGQPLPPRPAQDGLAAPQAAGLREEEGREPLSVTDRPARHPPLTDRTGCALGRARSPWRQAVRRDLPRTADRPPGPSDPEGSPRDMQATGSAGQRPRCTAPGQGVRPPMT